MLLNITKAKANPGSKVNFDTTVKLQDSLIDDKNYKFLSGASVKGSMYYQSEQLYVEAGVVVKILAVCDKCGEAFERELKFDFAETFVESYNSTSEEEYIINQTNVQIDKVVEDNLLLNIPTKMLCKPTCKGLCSICGKNKNFLSCNCEQFFQNENDTIN